MLKKFLILLAIFSFSFLSVQAQNYFSFACSNERPFTEKDFKKWRDNDVGLIITPAEKKSFRKLKNYEDRNAFIESFWRRRDPNPDTEENE